ncbi:DUF402 domain-containing protein [Paenibacillus allorhizosphaerae]|uniref:DUF402 domain-containing protein n=1 Tax=Paenibacillus allorhizosphaerae TaxID=2849866 RepID=A0ABM8VCX6_9BACL|nr:DUF402 domain-containing protein [Paenibacillus allorhizosphaerae]CAG7625419.1 hypothetical protein PAECIP111802_01167 [Paenibacillus allorhizosphaerae]
MEPITIESRLGTMKGYGNDEIVYFDRFDPKSDKEIRHFILMNEGVKIMFEPFGWKNEWYVDLIKIERCDENTISLEDMYIDVIVEGNGPTYRIVDLDEYADGVLEGKVSLTEMKTQMLQIQTFLIKYIHKGKEFPPEIIKDLMRNTGRAEESEFKEGPSII